MPSENSLGKFLEIACLPELKGKLLLPRASALFSQDMKHFLWANAAACGLFQAGSIHDLLRQPVDPSRSLARQLHSAASQIRDGQFVVRGFRTRIGGKVDFIQCELKSVRIGEAETGVLVTQLEGGAGRKRPEHEIARDFVDAFGESGSGIAITDVFGLILAANDAFLEIDLEPEAITETLHGHPSPSSSVVKSKISAANQQESALLLAPIADNPARFLAMVSLEAGTVTAAEQDAGSETAARPAETNPAGQATEIDQEGGVWVAPAEQKEDVPAFAASDEVPEENVRPDLRLDESGSHDDPDMEKKKEGIAAATEATEDMQPRTETGIEQRHASVSRTASPDRSILDRWYSPLSNIELTGKPHRDTSNEQNASALSAPEDAAAGSETDSGMEANEQPSLEDPDPGENKAASAGEAEGEAPAAPAIFTFAGTGEPVRFAWTVDADGVFRSVSPELAATVGPNAADIEGRQWRDIANVFGFDRSGEIAALLERRDTWSGKSVLWPVQGTDLSVPVDLAALPVFGAARQFDGFRGFGIIRVADAIVDPEEIGQALRDDLSNGEVGSGPIEDDDPPRRLASRSDRHGNDTSATDPTPTPSNVVNLRRRPEQEQTAEDDDQPTKAAPDPAEDTTREERLSGREARAFDEIARKLQARSSSPETEGEKEDGKGRETPALPETDDPVAAKTPGYDAPASAAKTGSILAAIPVPVLVYRNGDTLYANPELLHVTGYDSAEEIAEAGGVDALFSADIAEAGENPVMSLQRKDGTSIAVSPLLHSVPWEDGKALLLTFRMPAKIAVADQTAIDMARVSELENILDTATDGIIITSGDGTIESINASAEALFGIDHDPAKTMLLTDLFAQESRGAIQEYLSEISQPGVAGILNDGREVIGKEANGGLIPIFVTIGRIGESGKYCTVLRDITQWKKAEEEMVNATRSAETASEQKTEFLARISHEIRTPLNAIIGFSDVMIEERFGPIENERYRGYLRDINRSGVHVLDLINDLLDISKIEAGKMEMSYEAVDLNQIVSETAALLQPQANGERIIIRTSLSRAVPRVVADVRSIRQIILNLVSNAIKFTGTNGQVVISTVYEGNGEVVLRVRDTGRGMTEKELEYAMKPFHRISVDDEKRGRGTGLGLPLTKALVEANRAYFELESEPGEGTIAHVHFPTQRVLAD